MKKFNLFTKLAIFTLVFFYCISGGASFYNPTDFIQTDCAYAAKDVPSWMKAGGDDAKEELGDMSEKVFGLVLFMAFCSGAIGFAWGLAEINGIIGEAEKGPTKIRRGLVTVAVSTVAYAIISFFL